MSARPIAPDWAGEAVFIIAGGPSATAQDLSLLAGRRILAVNSSYQRLPQFGLPPPHLPHIDVLLFADNRWWADKKGASAHRDVVYKLPCELVTVAQHRVDFSTHPRVRRFFKHRPPGLSPHQHSLTCEKTVLSPALNYVHFRAPKSLIVLIGADGKFGADGRRNHHKGYPWRHIEGTWERHHAELKTLVEPLKRAGHQVINASPGSAWADLWPVVTLEQAIAAADERRRPTASRS